MLYKSFDWFMQKLGRKYALVDMYGNVTTHRYYIGFVEKNVATTWKERFLPNLYIHHFMKEDALVSGLGETAHTHPWSTLSVVLKGGYLEETSYQDLKNYNAPAIIFRPWDNSHRLVTVQPNTWTLFFHGIRRGIWAFDLRVHDKICDYCEKNNGGKCYNEGKEKLMPFSIAKEIKPTSKQSKGWRETSWIKCDENFDALIEERKKSVKRKNIDVSKSIGPNVPLESTV